MDIRNIPVISCAAAVVGSGAAGLNAADELSNAGVDVLLLTDSLSGGTSLNAGSDKQTYYKLSISGDSPDSVRALAETFYAGGGMHGDHAYAMAALSTRGFLKLVQLGVPFPHNEWGEYVGYRTDHDERQRATSAGPLTSRMMGEALLRSVRGGTTRIREGVQLISLLKDAEGNAVGALFADASNPKTPYLLVNAGAILLCTGGAALAYGNTVFPDNQTGATGAALRAGAKANNLCYWQYGLASTKVKWNVSGSYQQAIPAYTDGERPVLFAAFDGEEDLLNSIFLKGYQWPFDARKAQGSSRVDRAALSISNAGGRVYMDFTREMCEDVLHKIGDEAREYLNACDALTEGPFQRLSRINPQAVAFYASHGIDLSKEPLEVAVCAQHSNGGIWIDAWWQTSVSGLYAAGECAGAFGIYRPGGSALNETQVGSLRAAQHIAHKGQMPLPEETFRAVIAVQVERDFDYLLLATQGQGGAWSADEIMHETRRGMDMHAGAVRNAEGMRRLNQRVSECLSEIQSAPAQPVDLKTAIRLRDTLTVQSAMLSAMLMQSRYAGGAGHMFSDCAPDNDAEAASGYAFETRDGATQAVPVRPLPAGGGWFEEIWHRYQSGAVYE